MGSLLNALNWKQGLSILIAAGAVVAGLAVFSRWIQERDFRPLYSALSAEDAASVLAEVKKGGSEFRLRDKGTMVLVPSARVAELRLQMASAGVPKSGRMGYELFDKTNIGASDFAERVNYQRALEGELERSVMSLQDVELARVHITFPKESIFLETHQPPKASVLVKLRAGAQLSAQNVAAICQLTSSGVQGLGPESVSVVDMRGNLLNKGRHAFSADDPAPSEAALDYRQKIERDLLSKINSTLEPLLGPDKFRATAWVECDFTTGEQSDETYDPTKTVMVTSQKTEDMPGGTAAAGVPGIPSNLSRPTSRPGAGSAGVSRRTENTAYQSSHTVRHSRLPQGNIKRMSVSLLLDSNVRMEGAGPRAKRIVEPPTAESLKAIHDLVAGVIGFSAERGDQLIVETLPFEATLNPEPPSTAAKPAPSPPVPWYEQALKNKYVLIGAGVGVAVMLTLLMVVVSLLRRPPLEQAQMAAWTAPPGPDLKKQIENQLAEQASLRLKQEVDALNTLKLPPVTKRADVLTKHIVEEAKKDSSSMAQVLRTWMTEPKN